MRVICVRTGNKFDQWYENNLKYMVDKYSNLQYNEFAVIREGQYEGVFNKLHMFEQFKDGQNIYFDLDVLIKGDCNKFLSKSLCVCRWLLCRCARQMEDQWATHPCAKRFYPNRCMCAAASSADTPGRWKTNGRHIPVQKFLPKPLCKDRPGC